MIADKVVCQMITESSIRKILYICKLLQVNDDDKVISNKGVTRKDFGIGEDDFVFCSFNQPYKITPIEFNSWMKILKSVPNSVLWLMDYFDLSKANLKIILNPVVLILIGLFL